MSDTYTKLFSSITESTIVSEPVATRWLWVTMLAMANAQGQVYGSIPGLARRANLTVEETERGLATFFAPDPYSRTKENEGRRVEAMGGDGWLLLNHAKYAAIRNEAERADYKRNWDREHRPSGHARQSDSSPTQSDTSDKSPIGPTAPTTPTPALTKEKKDQKKKHARETRAVLVKLPDGFAISDSVKRWAQAKGHGQLEAHLEAFIETATAKAYAYADWDMAFKKAIREDWAGLRNPKYENRSSSRKLSAVERVEAACEADRQCEADERFTLTAHG